MIDVRPYTLSLVSAGGAVLELADVKAHLRVDFPDDDALITSYMASAQALMDGRDGRLGRALLAQQWQMQQDRFPRPYRRWHPTNADIARRSSLEVRIPLPPLQTIQSVGYVDENSVSQTLDPSLYRVVNGGGGFSSIVPTAGTSWPPTAHEPDAVTIDFTCGYETVEALNIERPGIAQAMLLLIGVWYENRTALSDSSVTAVLPFGFEQLIAQHRASWF